MITEEQRLHQLRTYKDEYASAKSKRVYLDHFRKSKLAMLTRDAIVAGAKSFAAAENEARCHSEYLQVLEGLRDAVEVEEKLSWELKVALAGIDIWRTKQSNERSERKGYGN